VASTRPGAPQAVSVKVASRRLVVRWAAPAANGSKAVTKYRTKVHAKVGTKLKLRATCTAKAKQRMCRTGKLAKRATYVVTVQARNAKGYGPASAPVLARVR
jgi:hypothetical protein